MSDLESASHRPDLAIQSPVVAGDADSGLAKGVLSTGEVLAQSIANIAPSYGAALTIALISRRRG